MKQIIIRTENCKLKIIYKGYFDSAIDGATNEDDKILGYGKYTIKSEDYPKMVEFFGGEDKMPSCFGDVVSNFDWEDKSYDFETTDADMFIYYVHFLINTRKNATVEVEGEHVFWFIHDVFHAENDICGRDFDCGAEIELKRFREAFQFLQKKRITMRKDYIETIVEAFNKRKWGCYNAWARTRDLITVDSFKEKEYSYYS